jgi:hypothetical protein
MPNSLSTDIRASIQWLFQESLELSSVSDSSKLEYAQSTANGTGDDQADLIWHDQRLVPASSEDDLDLGELTSTIFGNQLTIELAKVKALLIINTSSVAGDVLHVGGAGSAAFNGPFNADDDAVMEVGPGDSLLVSCKMEGWPVVDTSGDVLRIANPGASPITYRIAIVGTSS